MAIEAGQGFIDIIPRTDKFLASLNAQVTKAVASATAGATTTSQKLARGATLGIVALGTAAVVAIGKAVQVTQEWAGDVRALQRVIGGSAESASALLGASEVLGIGVDQLSVGFGILSKNIVNAAPNLTKYGIAVRDAQGNTLGFDTILDSVAARFNELPSGIEQTAFAMNVFGRSGKTLIPLLKRNVDGIAALKDRAAELGLVLSQDDLDATKELAIAQRELGHAFEGVGVSLGKEFIPALVQGVKGVTSFVEVFDRIPGPVLASVVGFTALTGVVAALFKVAGFFTSTWTKLLAILPGGAAAQTAAAAAAGTQATATEALSLAVTELTAAIGVALPVATVRGEAGLAGFGVTETGLLVPTRALTAALEQQAVAAGAAGSAAVGAGAASRGLLATGAAVLSRLAPLAIGAFALGSVSGAPTDELKAFNDQLTFTQRAFAAGNLKGAALEEQVHFLATAFHQNADAVRTSITTGDAFDVVAKRLGVDTAALVSQLTGAQQAFTDVVPDAAIDNLNKFALGISSGLDRLATVSGVDTEKIKSDLAGLFDPKVQADPTAFLNATQAVLDETQAAWASWHDSIVQSLGGASGALSGFLGQQNVSFDKLNASLAKQGQALRTFGQDFAEVSKEGGKAAQGFLEFVSENGLQAAGILDAVADKPRKIQQQFLEQFNKVQGQTDTLATSMQKALDPIFDRVLLQLKNIVRAIQGLPPLKMDTSQAKAGLAFIRQQIADIEGVHRSTIIISREFRGGGGHALAEGAVVRAAQGVVTRPTILAGESSRMTFAGRGAEGVIPFDDRGIGILSEALRRAMAKAGARGGDSPDIVINVQVPLDGKIIYENQTRHQQRNRMVRGG